VAKPWQVFVDCHSPVDHHVSSRRLYIDCPPEDLSESSTNTLTLYDTTKTQSLYIHNNSLQAAMRTSILWTIAFGLCATAYSSPREGPELEIRSAEPGISTLSQYIRDDLLLTTCRCKHILFVIVHIFSQEIDTRIAQGGSKRRFLPCHLGHCRSGPEGELCRLQQGCNRCDQIRFPRFRFVVVIWKSCILIVR